MSGLGGVVYFVFWVVGGRGEERWLLGEGERGGFGVLCGVWGVVASLVVCESGLAMRRVVVVGGIYCG